MSSKPAVNRKSKNLPGILKAYLIGSSFTAIAIFLLAVQIANSPVAERSPSSTLKKNHGFIEDKTIKHTRKLGPSIELKILVPETIPLNEPITLEANVISSAQFNNLDLKWVLSDGVRHISGDLQPTLINVVPKGKYQVELTVEVTDQDSAKVFLNASATSGPNRYGAVANLNLTNKPSKTNKDQISQKQKPKKTTPGKIFR